MAEETLADLFLAAGIREQRRPRPLSMRPAWQRTPEANTPYRAPQQALADRNTVPYLRQETRNERRQQSDLAQFALEHEAARNEVNTPPGTYLGQDALEMTGLPSVARGIGHLRDQEPGQALPELALGGLGVFGMVAGGGGRTPRARPPMRAALPEIAAEAPTLPSASPSFEMTETSQGRAYRVPIDDSSHATLHVTRPLPGLGYAGARFTVEGRPASRGSAVRLMRDVTAALKADANQFGETQYRFTAADPRLSRIYDGLANRALREAGYSETLGSQLRRTLSEALPSDREASIVEEVLLSGRTYNRNLITPTTRAPNAEAPRLPNAPARLPGRATDGSVLPIRPPQPIRQSMVGGSDDLAEAAAMRPQARSGPDVGPMQGENAPRRMADGTIALDQYMPNHGEWTEPMETALRREVQANRFVEQEVPITDLTTTQQSVFPHFAQTIDNRGGHGLPIVYRTQDGRLLLVDGHHRAAANAASGNGSLRVRVYSEPARTAPDGGPPQTGRAPAIDFQSWGVRTSEPRRMFEGEDSMHVDFLREDGGNGGGMTYRDMPDAVYIDGLQGSRSSGQGSRAVKAMIAYAEATNRPVIATNTGGALPYWSTMGFRRIGENSRGLDADWNHIFDAQQAAGVRSGDINSTIWGHDRGYGDMFEAKYGPTLPARNGPNAGPPPRPRPPPRRTQ